MMCWAARRVEYMSIAATVVNSLPVSPRAITRLNRQQHASADTDPPHSASTPSRALTPCTITDDDEDNSISNWYNESTNTRRSIVFARWRPYTYRPNWINLHHWTKVIILYSVQSYWRTLYTNVYIRAISNQLLVPLSFHNISHISTSQRLPHYGGTHTHTHTHTQLTQT